MAQNETDHHDLKTVAVVDGGDAFTEHDDVLDGGNASGEKY